MFNKNKYNIANEDSGSFKDDEDTSKNNKMKQVQKAIESSKQSVRNAIDRALERGEKLEELESKADNLVDEAAIFQKSATKVQREMCWQYVKTRLLCFFIFIVCIYFIYKNKYKNT